MTDPAELNRLRWRCRRGLRELELVLQPFVDNSYPALAGWEQAAFRRLLSLPDVVLLAYIHGTARPTDQELRHIVEKLTC